MQGLERRTPDVGIGATIRVEDANVQMIIDVVDALDVTGVADRRVALREASDLPRRTTVPSTDEIATSSGDVSRRSRASAPRTSSSIFTS